MIVKSKTRHDKSYLQLVSYILAEHKQVRNEYGNAVVIKHNIIGNTPQALAKQFLNNEKLFRQRVRSNTVYMYHDTLSFAKGEYVSLKILEDITKKFIKLRYDKAQVVACVHGDRQHWHVHLAVSGIQYRAGITNRITKEKYAAIKREVENYQRSKYPNLVKSCVDHGKKEKARLDKAYFLKQRTKEPTEKEQLCTLLNTYFSQALSQKHFFELLKENNIEPYVRGGRITGVLWGRKYRLKRLNFTPEKLAMLDKQIDRVLALKRIRAQKQRGTGKERYL